MKDLELNEIAGIKVITNEVNAKLISIIKKYRKSAFSEIERDIRNHEFVLSCNYIEEDSKVKKLIKCYDELTKNNYEVDVYFAGEKEDIQVLRNWVQTSDEISDEGWEDFDN